MSMVICDHCDRLFDSDADPDCFIEPPYATPASRSVQDIICEPCRERALDRQQERRAEDAP